MVKLEKKHTLNLETDMKRRPVNPRMIDSSMGPHLTLDSVPWNNVEEARLARSLFDGWRKKHCLKTMEDWHHWQDFYQTRLALRTLNIRLKDGENSADILKRIFLRAWVREMWGLERDRTFKQMAAWLTELGYPTKLSDLTNASRKGLDVPTNAGPLTALSSRLVNELTTEFPRLQHEFLIAPQKN